MTVILSLSQDSFGPHFSGLTLPEKAILQSIQKERTAKLGPAAWMLYSHGSKAQWEVAWPLDSSFMAYIKNGWCYFPWHWSLDSVLPARHQLGLVPNLMWHYSSLFSPTTHFWAELFILPLKDDRTSDQTQGREREDRSANSVKLENLA